MSSIDCTKLILSLLVVLLHINGSIIVGIPGIDWINHLLGALAVPCFLVYSGYFFAQSLKRKSLVEGLRGTTIRLLVLSIVYQSIWIIFLMPNGNVWTRLVASDDRFMFIVNILFELLCDGLYQFWYITAALLGILLCGWFIHIQKEKIGLTISIVLFIISVLVSTWDIPVLSDGLILLIQPVEIVFERFDQSVASVWLFLWIGYFHQSILQWFEQHRFMFALSIGLYGLEFILYLSGYGHALSLWLTSPLISIVILALTTRHQLPISKNISVFIRHLSTLIYCIHYQLAMVFTNGFAQGTMIFDPLMTPLTYFALLFGLSIVIVFVITKLSSHNRHRYLTYLY